MRHGRYWVILLFFFTSFCGRAADTTFVLFIGNSFTDNYDVPGLLDSMARHEGLPLHTGKFLRLGQSISYFADNDTCFNLIRSRDWSFIVFQDNQSNYVDTAGKIPGDIVSLNLKFQDSIKKLVPCTHIIYAACWEKKGGFPARFPGDNTERLYKRIFANYTWLNSRPGTNNIIAPVGLAWLRLITDHPELNPYNEADNRHPSLIGAYAFAAAIYAILYDNDYKKADYRNVFTADVAGIIQNAALHAVQTHYTGINLPSVVIPVRFKNRKLMAPAGYARYQWYCNDKPIKGGIKNTISFGKGQKHYWVKAWDKKGCMYSSRKIVAGDTICIQRK
jgi:hypothetical protein